MNNDSEIYSFMGAGIAATGSVLILKIIFTFYQTLWPLIIIYLIIGFIVGLISERIFKSGFDYEYSSMGSFDGYTYRIQLKKYSFKNNLVCIFFPYTVYEIINKGIREKNIYGNYIDANKTVIKAAQGGFSYWILNSFTWALRIPFNVAGIIGLKLLIDKHSGKTHSLFITKRVKKFWGIKDVPANETKRNLRR